jgi:tRNA-guanine family transglycosylase
MKGVTARQVKDVGITLILNNTYHLGLRPGTEVLDLIGGKCCSFISLGCVADSIRQARTNFRIGMETF